MADTEISNLRQLPADLVESDDVLAIVSIAASETMKVPALTLVTEGIKNVADDSVPPSVIDWSDIADGAINGAAIADRSIDNTKLVLSTITVDEIADNAITQDKLNDDSVGSDQIIDEAVGEDALKDDLNGDNILLEKSVSTAIADDAINSDKIADDSVGSEHIKDNAILTAAILDGNVTDAKIDTVNGSKISDGTITSAKLSVTDTVNGTLAAVDTVNIRNGAVTNDKIANGVDGAKISSGTITSTQLSITDTVAGTLAAVDSVNIRDSAVTDAKIANGISGAKISNGTLNAAAFTASSFANGITLVTDENGTTIEIDNAITAATHNGITFSAQGLITGTSTLAATDIPLATSSTVGGVSIPSTGGLAVTGTGALSINNTITGGSTLGITYNSHGLITAVEDIPADAFPIATNTTLGTVIVPLENSNPIAVDTNGNLTFATSGVTAGTYVNLTVNEYGIVTSGSATLNADQVPDLDASKITSGSFSTARIATDAITMANLADKSVSFIQEAQPSIDSTVLHIGCYWYQPSTAQLRIWTGNDFAAVGFGRLSQDNLRWGGVVDGSTGLVTNLTDRGREAGIEVSTPLPTATNALGGLYFVVSPGGTSIAVTPSITYDPGDWCLCVNELDGWIRIDTAPSGGGGGGGAQYLADLLDVNLNEGLAEGNMLVYTADASWVNTDVIDGGTY